MRSENDEWTITESVGVTALGVASSRAMETRRPDGLVDDPHAGSFLDAVRDEIDLPDEVDPQAEPTDPASGLLSTYVGVRSRWFDEHLDRITELSARRAASSSSTSPTRSTTWPTTTSSRPPGSASASTCATWS